MARYESEGYCPSIWVHRELFSKEVDNRLLGLWQLVRDVVVYDREPNTRPKSNRVDEMFYKDPIAFHLLSAIVRANVNASKIKVFQPWSGLNQDLSEIQRVLEEKPESALVLAPGSEFCVIITDADYGLDVFVWDLKEI